MNDVPDFERLAVASVLAAVLKAATKSKSEVDYRKSTDKGRECGTCSMFVKPDACTLVRGTIKPSDVCDEWEPKNSTKVAKTPEGEESAERLREYWTHGEGGAKIGWGAPGDFDRCVLELGKYVEDAKGYCAERHHDALGIWPATHAAEERGRKGRFLNAGEITKIEFDNEPND